MTDQKLSIPVTEHLKRVNAALALRDIPDYPAALDQLQRAAILAPGDASIQLLLGLTYQDLAEFEHSESALRQALALDPDSVEARQTLGLLLVRGNHNDEAVEILRPLIERDVHNPAVVRAYASALAYTGQLTAAIEILKVAYQHWPNDPEVVSQLGHALLEANQPDEALPILQQAVNLRTAPDALCELAAAYTMKSKFDTALKLLQQSIDLNPKHDRTWRGLAYCYLNLDQPDQALMAADKALEYNPQHFRNWQIKADVLSALGRREEVLPVLNRGIDLARQATSGQLVLQNLMVVRAMEIFRQTGPQAALQQIETDLQDMPNHLGLLEAKKNICLVTGDYERALDVIRQAETNGVNSTALIWDFFQVYHGLNRPDHALAAVQPLLANPEADRTEFYEEMEKIGIRLYQNRQHLAARRVFEQVLALEPHRGRSMNNLAFVLIGEHAWDQAEELLRAAPENGFESPATSLANLGYVYLCQAQTTQAIATLEAAEQQAATDDKSIMRVAIWYQGAFSDTAEERFPHRFVPVLLAIRANLASALYLNGQEQDAFDMAQAAISADPKDSLGYRVLGCLHLAHGNLAAARTAWRKALRSRQTMVSKQLIETWLAALPNDKN